jgi:hypothetical protein
MQSRLESSTSHSLAASETFINTLRIGERETRWGTVRARACCTCATRPIAIDRRGPPRATNGAIDSLLHRGSGRHVQ